MTELDELKQRLEIEELRGRLSAAEKQISILTDTLATLTEIQTSDRLGSYINSQVRLLKAAEFLNSVSDGEKIAPQLQHGGHALLVHRQIRAPVHFHSTAPGRQRRQLKPAVCLHGLIVGGKDLFPRQGAGLFFRLLRRHGSVLCHKLRRLEILRSTAVHSSAASAEQQHQQQRRQAPLLHLHLPLRKQGVSLLFEIHAPSFTVS